MSFVERAVLCKACESVNQNKFVAEMGIRSPGLKNIDKPTVWVFPQLVVCMDCGMAEFVVPDAELRLLAEGGVVAADDYLRRSSEFSL
jgi:hypothetical protein